ncbi:MAG: HNH endonuclease [Euryarchaeota archaeon]|nr:HNH endonuclease [Euryarchaeota archaeon]MBU4454183.1 HNH endonuclease [Euryarchaeota archaeon]MCG2734980.1 hypothetical protein [Candidatus Methanoperedenaceae archaeon]
MRKDMKMRDIINTDIINAGETVLVVFTRGNYFTYEQDGNGSTGNWKINKNREIDKIIIYKRMTHDHNQIYVGIKSDIIDSKEEGRFVIRMKNIKLVGTTNHNWKEFKENDSSSPIMYKTK